MESWENYEHRKLGNSTTGKLRSYFPVSVHQYQLPSVQASMFRSQSGGDAGLNRRAFRAFEAISTRNNTRPAMRAQDRMSHKRRTYLAASHARRSSKGSRKGGVPVLRLHTNVTHEPLLSCCLLHSVAHVMQPVTCVFCGTSYPARALQALYCFTC